jgi:hypothetical protein
MPDLKGKKPIYADSDSDDDFPKYDFTSENNEHPDGASSSKLKRLKRPISESSDLSVDNQIAPPTQFPDGHIAFSKTIKDIINKHALTYASLLCKKENMQNEINQLEKHKAESTFPQSITSNLNISRMWGPPSERDELLITLRTSALKFMIDKKDNEKLELEKRISTYTLTVKTEIDDHCDALQKTLGEDTQVLQFNERQSGFLAREFGNLTIQKVSEMKSRQKRHEEQKAKKQADFLHKKAADNAVVNLTKKEYEKLLGNAGKKKGNKPKPAKKKGKQQPKN